MERPCQSGDPQENLRLVANPEGARNGLMVTPRFERMMPLYLRIGFPTPTATRIDRRGADTRWVIQMRGGEMKLKPFSSEDSEKV